MISKILFSKNPRNLSLSFQDHKKRSQMWIPYFNLSNLRSRPHPQGQESQETDQDPGSIYQDSGSTFQIKQPKFLPSRKVMEKTQKLRSNLTREMLSGTTFTNILTMTFRQVTLQHLWNFDTFIPEVERNMDDLETLREVPPSFAITSSDERVISVIAEVICISSLESTKRHLFDETPGGVAKKYFLWFHTHKSIISKDSSVSLYNLMGCEIVANADILLQKFSSERANYRPREGRWMVNWLTSNTYSKLEQTGGPEFISWLSEYVPAYKLLIDADKLGNVKFEGWKETTTNTLEVFLTHFQMVTPCSLNFCFLHHI
ncbi:putative WUSCHEL-related homeobox 9-like [Capsicum annuum]|uniref:Uncharacterized protein n=1 Tax=Capsicum annuum TaxID=4072 RepID=A0A2G2ZLW1_CAPAN|nr:putative WUSCHEL-related homeobox 9-like [Capsicum annuum]PHT82979.1 hypothetical protein T459_11422 [Capsicum annuum]